MQHSLSSLYLVILYLWMSYFTFILDNEGERKFANQGRPAKKIETKLDKVEYKHLFISRYFGHFLATFMKLKLSI